MAKQRSQIISVFTAGRELRMRGEGGETGLGVFKITIGEGVGGDGGGGLLKDGTELWEAKKVKI